MYKLTVKLTRKKSTLRIEYYKFIASSMMRVLKYIDALEEYKRRERFELKKRDRFFNKTKLEYKIELVTSRIEEQCGVAMRNSSWTWSTVKKDMGIPALFQFYFYPDFISLDDDTDIYGQVFRELQPSPFVDLSTALLMKPESKKIRDFKKNLLSNKEKTKVKLIADMLNNFNNYEI